MESNVRLRLAEPGKGADDEMHVWWKELPNCEENQMRLPVPQRVYHINTPFSCCTPCRLTLGNDTGSTAGNDQF